MADETVYGSLHDPEYTHIHQVTYYHHILVSNCRQDGRSAGDCFEYFGGALQSTLNPKP